MDKLELEYYWRKASEDETLSPYWRAIIKSLISLLRAELEREPVTSKTGR